MSEATVRPTQEVVADLTAYLINSGAQNYIEDHYTVSLDGGPETTAVITVQYTDKPSAHELRIRAEAERDEQRETCNQWRNLALQFDAHRMNAMALIRAVAAGKATAEDCAEFAARPPEPGSEISAESDRLRELLRDASAYTRHPDYDWDHGLIKDVQAALEIKP